MSKTTKAPAVALPEPLAIIGMACMFPKADGLGAYWANIRDRIDCVTEVPPSHFSIDDYFDPDTKSPDRTYCRRGGFLTPVRFDPGEFGISPNTLEAIDTSQLLSLVVAREALRDAGYDPRTEFDRKRVSVILGVTGTLELVIPLGARLGHPVWRRALRDSGVAGDQAEEVVRRISESYVEWQESSFPGLLGNVVAGRIANRFNLGGTNCTVDAACASSLSAAHLSMLELASGRSKMVVTGGVDAFNDIFMYMCFSKTPALSPTGDSRPFDVKADGTIIGEGIGMVVLKRLSDAKADGNRIYALLTSIGTSSDGRGKSIYAPDPEGQRKAIEEAYRLAGVDPEQIEMVEAHGTGTKVGDAVEASALMDVYRSVGSGRAPWCALGSVKSQIGHTKAAAGVAGLIKAALALHHKVLPPTIKVTEPAPLLTEPGCPLYINTAPRPWMKRPGISRHAAVSSFGFGGSNFHAVLTEYQPEKAVATWDGSVQIMPISGPDTATVGAGLDAIAGLTTWDQIRVDASRLRQNFDPTHPVRVALVVVKDVDDLAKLCAQARERIDNSGTKGSPNVFVETGPPGELAVLFAGQGSQYVHMGRDLACAFPEMHAVLVDADDAFARATSAAGAAERLSDAIYPRPAWTDADQKAQDVALRATEVAQPALGAVGLGMLRVLERFGVRPEMVAGHSYGELVALCAAGRMQASELHHVSRRRGELMASGMGERGSMLAVKAAAEDLASIIAKERLGVVLANRNAPDQVVLAGSTSEIERAAQVLSGLGMRSVKLPVAAAFHSPLVAQAQAPLGEALQAVRFGQGRVPVWANSTALPYPEDAGSARALLAGQLARPVEFATMVERMHNAGARTFLEVGPGARLTGLVGSILRQKPHRAIALDASSGKRSSIVDLARALSQIAALGHPIELDSWEGGQAAVSHLLNRPEPKLSVTLSGANYRSPSRKGRTPAERPKTLAAPAPAQSISMDNDTRKNTTEGFSSRPTAASALTAAAIPTTAATAAAATAPTATARPGAAARPAATPVTAAATLPTAATLPMAATLSTAARVATAQAAPPGSACLATPHLLSEALRASQESLAALARHQEQVAQLHQQFLQGQDLAQRTFRALVEHQQALFLHSAGMEPQASTRPGPCVEIPADATAAFALPLPAQAIVEHARTTTAQASAPHPPFPTNLPQAPSSLAPALAPMPAPGPVAPLVTPLSSSVSGSASLSTSTPAPTSTSTSGSGSAPGAASGPASPRAATLPVSTAPRSAASVPPGLDVAAIVRKSVADTTGYPPEMLELTMDLEADLGIDSIKRVEIFSNLERNLPGAPVVRPDHMGTLRTLGQVVEFLGGGVTAATHDVPVATRGPTLEESVAPSPAAPAAAASAESAGEDQVGAVLLSIISEKTGYPTEMLAAGMDLEADLGIDSIKRVEIFSAVAAKLPQAPALKPEHMGTLRTLGDIVAFLERGTSKSAGGTAGHLSTRASSTIPDVGAPTASLAATGGSDAMLAQPLAQRIPSPDSSAALPGGPRHAAAEPATGTGLSREILVSVPIDDPAARRPIEFAADNLIWVADGGSELGAAIVQTLTRRGLKCTLSTAKSLLTPGNGAPIGGLVIVAPRRTASARGLWDPASERFLKEAFRVAQLAGGSLRQEGRARGAFLATVSWLDGAFGTSGLTRTQDPVSGGLAGLAKTVGHEWPEVHAKALDVAWSWTDMAAVANAVCREVLTEGPVEVGLSAEATVALALREQPLSPGEPGPDRLERGDVVLVSGGARGVTAEVAVELAREFGATLVLLGRTPVPTPEPEWLRSVTGEAAIKRALLASAGKKGLSPRKLESDYGRAMASREIRNTLARVERAGGRAVYSPVDVRDAEALAQVIATVRLEHGPIRGLIHGAGVLADRLLGEKTLDQFESVFDTKVGGLRALLTALATDDLKVMVLFSSVSGRFGRSGQVDYAMANEVLNKVARQQSLLRPGCRVLSAGWGPWDGGMVTPGLKKIFLQEGVGVIGLAEGAAHLVAELVAPRGNEIEVVLRGTGGVEASPAPVRRSRPERPMEVAFERRIDLERHPFLRSHVLNGRPVLPLAMTAEWLAHAAVAANPGLHFHGFDELRVLKGIVLEERPMDVRALVAPAQRDGHLFRVPVELQSADSRAVPLASATALLTARLPHPNGEAAAMDLGAPRRYPFSVEHAYENLLFHGPALRAIERIDQCSQVGLSAWVRPAPAPSEWMSEPLRDSWLTDPLAIDATFQLMILWTLDHQGSACLPCRVVRYRQYRNAYPAGGVRVLLRITGHKGSLFEATVLLTDEHGTLIARMDGFESTVDPHLKDAFQRRVVSQGARPLFPTA